MNHMKLKSTIAFIYDSYLKCVCSKSIKQSECKIDRNIRDIIYMQQIIKEPREALDSRHIFLHLLWN